MWIVKLGGSLARSSALIAWLATIGTVGSGRVVVVPGGGPYADAVRTEQRYWRFDDSTAHSMALLAMDQYGLQLLALANRSKHDEFVAAHSDDAIGQALQHGKTPVWLPARWVDTILDVPRIWDITSDSLAVWLAGRLSAAGVVLVKSVPIESGSASTTELVRRGWVDAGFPSLYASIGCAVYLLGHGQNQELNEVLHGFCRAGLRVA